MFFMSFDRSIRWSEEVVVEERAVKVKVVEQRSTQQVVAIEHRSSLL